MLSGLSLKGWYNAWYHPCMMKLGNRRKAMDDLALPELRAQAAKTMEDAQTTMFLVNMAAILAVGFLALVVVREVTRS